MLHPMHQVCRELERLHAVHIQMLCDGSAQVTEFQVVASEFLQRLKTSGPGLPNTDLAKGSELLKKFQVHIHKGLADQKTRLVALHG